jgi:hypothetical protein
MQNCLLSISGAIFIHARHLHSHGRLPSSIQAPRRRQASEAHQQLLPNHHLPPSSNQSINQSIPFHSSRNQIKSSYSPFPGQRRVVICLLQAQLRPRGFSSCPTGMRKCSIPWMTPSGLVMAASPFPAVVSSTSLPEGMGCEATGQESAASYRHGGGGCEPRLAREQSKKQKETSIWRGRL